jgi:hypothetical protein
MARIVSVIVVISLVTIGLFAQVQPVPGPGTGVVTVVGTVNVANTPSVNAVQSGEWKVSVANAPSVVLAPPEFLHLRGRYHIVWSSGQEETISVMQIGSGGWGSWVKGQTTDGRVRWINVAAAASVQELP